MVSVDVMHHVYLLEYGTDLEKINVLTNATKHKETMVHKRFRQKLSSSGVRRWTDNKKEEGSEEEDRQGADVNKC